MLTIYRRNAIILFVYIIIRPNTNVRKMYDQSAKVCGRDRDVSHEGPVRPPRGNHTPGLHKAAAQCPQFALFTCDCAPKKASALTLLTVTMPGKVGLSRFCQREHCAAGPHPRQPTNKQTIARVTYYGSYTPRVASSCLTLICYSVRLKQQRDSSNY